MAAGPGSKRGAAAAPRADGLAPGLYVVATPIGNAGDITRRAVDVLARADAIAAEDTRRARRLLDTCGVAVAGRPMIPYHDHNGAAQRPALLARLAAGESVALVSDAGTPLLADPGWKLVRAAIDAGAPVHPLPGPSALLAALTAAGLPTDRFLFAGFPPPREAERARWLAELAPLRATLVFYEAPHRLADTLAALATALGPREAAVCRELTKTHEEIRRGPLSDLAAAYAAGAERRGEIVVVVGPPNEDAHDPGATRAAVDAALRTALETLSVRDAAREVAAALDAPRKAVYQRAVELRGRRE
ncbi:MAG: 16S rRNA (cytidine(1402)-2'-O)-methyltransferase [Rhodobacteraceae bacterium]|nr:MAG: 16S rRNA (cytidine(1402)-2'-O)-methyltransferase [Paracoccaceae bacterium]